jgi:hypothetical protein
VLAFVVSSPLGAGQALPRRLFPPVRPGVGTDDRLVVSRQRAFEERPRRLKVALRRATGRHPVAASCRNSNCRSASRGHAAAGQPQPAASAPPQAAAMSEVTAWPKRSIPVAGSTRLGALSATAETLNETARVLATFRRKNNSPSVWSVDVEHAVAFKSGVRHVVVQHGIQTPRKRPKCPKDSCKTMVQKSWNRKPLNKRWHHQPLRVSFPGCPAGLTRAGTGSKARRARRQSASVI